MADTHGWVVTLEYGRSFYEQWVHESYAKSEAQVKAIACAKLRKELGLSRKAYTPVVKMRKVGDAVAVNRVREQYGQLTLF
jgi:hypothetical protein